MSKKKKSNGATIFLIVFLFLLVAGLTGFVLLDERRKKNNSPEPEKKQSQQQTINVPVRDDSFPLKKRSFGTRVKLLQEALIRKFGPSILPRYGADSDFGTETETALISKGYGAVIDAMTFDKIIRDNAPAATESGTSVIDYKSLAAKLKTAFDGVGTDNTVVLDLLNPARNKVYLKGLRDTYDQAYGVAPNKSGTLINTLESEQEGSEFAQIINLLKVL